VQGRGGDGLLERRKGKRVGGVCGGLERKRREGRGGDLGGREGELNGMRDGRSLEESEWRKRRCRSGPLEGEKGLLQC